MRKKLWTLLAVGALASGSLAIACGDDDDVTNTTPKDGGSDVVVVTPDANPPPPDGGGDAGCTFAGFVLNLVNTQTSATTTPSADLGEACTPSTSQDDFKSLFP